jgi:hypothetical protein
MIIVLKLDADVGIPIETADFVLNRNRYVQEIASPAAVDKPGLIGAASGLRYQLCWDMHGVPVRLRRCEICERRPVILDLSRYLVEFGGARAAREERGHQRQPNQCNDQRYPDHRAATAVAAARIGLRSASRKTDIGDPVRWLRAVQRAVRLLARPIAVARLQLRCRNKEPQRHPPSGQYRSERPQRRLHPFSLHARASVEMTLRAPIRKDQRKSRRDHRRESLVPQ